MKFFLRCLWFGLLFLTVEVSAQTYSMSLNNIPLRDVIRGIEQQGDYRFFYSDDVVNLNCHVQINATHATIEQILDIILPTCSLDYQMLDNNQIIIKPLAVRPDMMITGTVTDSNGETLPGASVAIKGTAQGTVTNPDGVYSIMVHNRDAALIFSFVGFATKEIPVGNQTFINVSLEEDNYQLNEVVVTALGILRAQKALSYHVQEIQGMELSSVKSANFINSLSGKVAGVQINTGAAGTGSAVKLVMRGPKSLSKNNNALYVLDGVPMYHSGWRNDLNAGFYSVQPGTDAVADINPEDIESISMLTGPSAAALYGYEGANGIVLITTKKGRADGTSITASNSTAFSTPMMTPKFQNKYGNIKDEPESWGDETTYRYNPVRFFNTGRNVSNNLSVASGNEKSQTYFSMASVNASGILPNNTYDRYNFTFRNTTSFLNDKLVLDATANYIIQKDKNMVAQGQYFNPLPALYLFPRGEDFDEIRRFEYFDDLQGIYTQYWPHGRQGLSLQNPYWMMHRMNRELNRKRYRLSATLQYQITGWLNVTGRVHTDNTDFRHTEKRHAGTLATFAGVKGFYSLENRREQQTYADLIANADRYFGNFNINVNLGAAIKDYYMDCHHVRGNLDRITNWFTTENIERIHVIADDDGKRQQTQSVFASTEIGYKSMIYLTLTGRNDWDSALAFSETGVKSFFYPSAGVSLIISEMTKLPSWVSFLKASMSYTSVGSAYDAYMTKERYVYDEQTDQYKSSPLYPNRNLKPELTRAYEAGLNMRFFKGALCLDAAWYRTNTFNQTFIADLPVGEYGYSGVYVQSGDVQNTGIEVTFGFNRKWKNFTWNTRLTYSYNDNIIQKLADGIKNPVTGTTIHMPYLNMTTLGDSGSPEVRLLEGGSMGDIYVKRDWEVDDSGNLLLDEKMLPSLTDTHYQKAGSVLPKAYTGWKNTFAFKDISLNVLINARFGGVVVSNTQAIIDRYGVSAYSANMRDRQIPVRNISIPVRDYLNIVAAGTGQGAHYVYNATNVRLGELSIHYTIPKKWTGNIADVTIGLVGANLAMIYGKAPFDPELAASPTNSYYTGVDYFMQPGLRSLGVNVRLGF